MRLSRSLLTLALAFGVLLLVANLPLIPASLHTYFSALPLAAAGLGYGLLQVRLRPTPGTLWKRLMLAATFLLWAVDQLLPAGRAASLIGDLVIVAYVLDLYWLMQEQVTIAPRRVDPIDRAA